MLKEFLRKENDKIVCSGDLLEIYIPESYFDTNVARFIGAEIHTMGLLYTRGYKGDKLLFTELMNLPSEIVLSPGSIKNLDVNLTGYDADTKYRVISFYKNMPVMQAYCMKNSDYVQSFVNMVLAGKINNVPYSKLINVWLKNMSINGIGLGVPATSLEIILSELYTPIDNPDITYGVAKNNNPSLNDLAYKTRNIREICSRSSTFAALTFEDFDTMMAASLNRNRENKPQEESPLEKVIKY
jgi:hypothetical protein